MMADRGRATRVLETVTPRVKQAAKVAAAGLLWARVAARLGTQRLAGRGAPTGRPVAAGSGVLRSREEWEQATRTMRALRLPTHPDGSKNWDTLAALSSTLAHTTPADRVLDAGAALYSTFLPALRLYGYTDLVGTNLEFGRPVSFGGVRLEHGDIESTGFASGSFGAVVCLSVIEHGVDVRAFVTEAARLVRPGGVVFVSTDYWADGVDTSDKTAYGTPVRIFDRASIEDIIEVAQEVGLEIDGGPIDLSCADRAVHWKRQDLRYTYVAITFRRGS